MEHYYHCVTQFVWSVLMLIVSLKITWPLMFIKEAVLSPVVITVVSFAVNGFSWCVVTTLTPVRNTQQYLYTCEGSTVCGQSISPPANTHTIHVIPVVLAMQGSFQKHVNTQHTLPSRYPAAEIPALLNKRGSSCLYFITAATERG